MHKSEESVKRSNHKQATSTTMPKAKEAVNPNLTQGNTLSRRIWVTGSSMLSHQTNGPDATGTNRQNANFDNGGYTNIANDEKNKQKKG